VRLTVRMISPQHGVLQTSRVDPEADASQLT